MQTEIILAGFGGQGVLFAGQMLAYAGMDAGMDVTWIPSYGPEMRGGTANCTVIIANEEIGSPMVAHPQAAIVLNLPSLDKYENAVKPGGVLVVNSSMTDRAVQRKDIEVIEIPATELAEKMGNRRMANMLLVGALLADLPVLPLKVVEKALKDHTPERHQSMVPANIQALRKGVEFRAGKIRTA